MSDVIHRALSPKQLVIPETENFIEKKSENLFCHTFQIIVHILGQKSSFAVNYVIVLSVRLPGQKKKHILGILFLKKTYEYVFADDRRGHRQDLYMHVNESHKLDLCYSAFCFSWLQKNKHLSTLFSKKTYEYISADDRPGHRQDRLLHPSTRERRGRRLLRTGLPTVPGRDDQKLQQLVLHFRWQACRGLADSQTGG